MIFILAGEASGDLHGANLVHAMPDQTFFGVAGPRMREAGVEELLPQEDFQIMGFTGILAALPRLRHQLNTCTQAILERRPEMVILIDYAGFNMRLAARLKKAGYKGKIVQYICPKVWAWGKGRIPKLAANLDLLLTILPFEPDCFKGTDLRVEYIGNPLTEKVNNHDTALKSPPTLALLPGSRRSEIKLNLPRQLRTAEALKRRLPDLRVILSVANASVAPLVGAPPGVELTAKTYDLMDTCDAALATSGTVNLELALRKVPTVVVYRISWLNAAIAGLVLRLNLPHYSLPNIILGETLFPELMHTKFTPKNATAHLLPFLQETSERRNCIEGCERVIQALRTTSASERAAELILQLL